LLILAGQFAITPGLATALGDDEGLASGEDGLGDGLGDATVGVGDCTLGVGPITGPG
jgi:hypothetical protein